MHDLKKAAERLIWRLKPDEKGEFKSFTPNKNDIESLNCILNWINNQKKDTLKNNQLFAKLYILGLTNIIRHQETTIFDPIPQKELSKILDYPLSSFYKSFTEDLYNNQLLKLNTSDLTNENKKVISDYREQRNLYPEGLIESKLNHMITEALNRFN